jgi:hypothetical protein
MIDKEKYILKIDMSKKNIGGAIDNKLHSANLRELEIKSFQPLSSTGSFKNILNNDNTSSFGLQQLGGAKFNKFFSKFVKDNYKNYKKGGRGSSGSGNYFSDTFMTNASYYPDLKFPKFTYGQDIQPEREMIF